MIIGIAVQLISNPFLKYWIQQPRPREDARRFRLLVASGQQPPLAQLGMPSGHAQLLSFVLVFTFLVSLSRQPQQQANKWLPFVAMTLVSLYIVYYKETTRQHSWTQLVAGATLGALMGVVFFQTSRRWTRGPLNQKPEDGFALSRFYSFG